MLKKIAVITGGYSAEKIVSIKSAETVIATLDRTKYIPFLIHIEKDNWHYEFEGKEYSINKNNFSLSLEDEEITFEAAFIALHGTPAEDGLLTAYFQLIGLPYTSCDPLAAQTTFDKGITIALAKSYKYTTAKSIELDASMKLEAMEKSKDLNFPIFVKPCHAGSSLGISRLTDINELDNALNLAFQHSSTCLIEEEVKGTEVTCGTYIEKGIVKTLPITEVVSHNDFFDFESKYHGKADEITPARITKEQEHLINETSKHIYRDFKLKGICRIDYILSNGKAYLIEINTVPGLTNESFIPQQVRASGMELKDFFNLLIEEII